MDTIIRKISIGSDPNQQLHISVGSVMGGKKIHLINEYLPKSYEVWVEQSETEGITLWKTVENMPVIVERDTRFS